MRDSAKDSRARTEGQLLRRFTIVLPDGGPTVELTCNSTAQHTIAWADKVTHAGASLPPGSCNLYRFPEVSLDGDPDSQNRPLDPSRVALLELMVLMLMDGDAMATTAGRPFCEQEDASGARPIHGLLIGNSDAAIALGVKLVERTPTRALDAHGPGPFLGENVLHILIVQSREEALCTLWARITAADALARPEVVDLLSQQVRAPRARGAELTAAECDLGGWRLRPRLEIATSGWRLWPRDGDCGLGREIVASGGSPRRCTRTDS